MPTAAKIRKYGHPLFYKAIEKIADLHEKKNRQYATPEDPLGNFRRTGRIIAKMLKPGLDPTLASCLAFMSKQVDGVYEIFGEDKKDTLDSLEDKLQDIAIYSLIALILVQEAQEKMEPLQPNTFLTGGPYCDECEQLADFQSADHSEFLCSNCLREKGLSPQQFFTLEH